MFVARNVDGGWFLALRGGRTIKYTDVIDNRRIDFRFQNQKQAKACADVLNRDYLEKYKARNDRFDNSQEMRDMVNYIISCVPSVIRTRAKRKVAA